MKIHQQPLRHQKSPQFLTELTSTSADLNSVLLQSRPDNDTTNATLKIKKNLSSSIKNPIDNEIHLLPRAKQVERPYRLPELPVHLPPPQPITEPNLTKISHPGPNVMPQADFNQSINLLQYNNIAIPSIDKYNGQTDILEYLEDFETRFALLPQVYSTD
ncbi:hypothetical protein EV44_g3732 [Erysiphe necator]|uniref:Uncharacterized protein n=1 Tax=Uncinula necator TaxID=52586 RepID=A0A0B1NZN3_UNCNE|nr:hypothetical protein EV44_g3732 [Erysiphe necator]